MPTEHGPSCHMLRNLRVSTTRRTVVDQAGKTKTILTRTFHCETSQSFVRSEEEDEIQRKMAKRASIVQ